MAKLLTKETEQMLRDLATFVKTGIDNHLANENTTNAENLLQYNRLVRNIFDDTLESAFPLTVSKLDEDEWKEMVDAFLKNGKIQSQELWKMPFEFVQFVVKKKFGKKFKRPYLGELMYFEWAEIAVFNMPNQKLKPYSKEVDLRNDKIYVNPYLEFLINEYPVHKDLADEILRVDGSYGLIVFRDPDNLDVMFVETSLVTNYLFSYMMEKHINLSQAAKILMKDFKYPNKEELEEMLYNLFVKMQENGIILGAYKSRSKKKE